MRPNKVTHSSGYVYHENDAEEFFEILEQFASDLLRARRDGRDAPPKPHFQRNPTWQVMLYYRIWRDYNDGLVAFEFDYDEESESLMKPKVASATYLKKLIEV